MKIGDLVKHKRLGDLALIVDIDETEVDHTWCTKIYKYPQFMWLDTGEIDSCADTFLEVVVGSR